MFFSFPRSQNKTLAFTMQVGLIELQPRSASLVLQHLRPLPNFNTRPLAAGGFFYRSNGSNRAGSASFA